MVSAAVGLSGCSSDTDPAAIPTSPATTLINTVPAPPPALPLPPPNALTDVLYRLADASVPGAEKINLVENGTSADAAALDKFSRALVDGGFTPLTIDAHDLAWSQADPGNIVATIVIATADENTGDFSYPMEFCPLGGGWQLNRQTADLLLQLGGAPAAPPR